MTDFHEADRRMAKIKGRTEIRVQVSPLLLAIAHGDQNEVRAVAAEFIRTMKEESDREHQEFMALAQKLSLT